MHDELKELARKYEEMAKKIEGFSSVESLLHQIDLPYNTRIMVMPVSPKFKVPQVVMYDGSKDLVDHLENFKGHITPHGFPGEIACRVFPLTLKGIARGLFGTLKPKSIDSFEELAKQFLTQFMPSRRHPRPVAYLLTVKQKEDENLKAYLTRFNKERLTMDDQDEKITLAALLGGVWPCSPFMAKLTRRTPSTLREFMDKADDFVNAEDTLQALVDPGKEDRGIERRNGQVDKKAKASRREREQERRSDHSPRLIYNNLDIREKGKERGDRRPTRKGSRYSKYHQTSSRWNEDCTTMKKRVAQLVEIGELERMVAELSRLRRCQESRQET
ncbi:uncharacterized protein LOC122277020 [Carya illinoinensis]|uniref:uncharacterized protein LOC122277020 n=1 Tax=Carya illinoinensis TaxID=32201 RepID=UPI001C728CC9|nr:uncharacterized protein LOC122277020 [Carya illinoinensis]